jgi:hypothetical protein
MTIAGRTRSILADSGRIDLCLHLLRGVEMDLRFNVVVVGVGGWNAGRGRGNDWRPVA